MSVRELLKADKSVQYQRTASLGDSPFYILICPAVDGLTAFGKKIRLILFVYLDQPEVFRITVFLPVILNVDMFELVQPR